MPAVKTIIVPPGKQLILRGKIENTTYDGKEKAGRAPNDNGDDAMIIVEDGAQLSNVRITGSRGVGVTIKGQKVTADHLEVDNNAGPGRMLHTRGDGTAGSSYHERDAELHHNNRKLKTTNAGNKATRSSDVIIERAYYHDECGPCQWWDINNERNTMIDCRFKAGIPDDKDRPPVLLRSELGLPGGLTVLRPTFQDTAYPALSLDESSNVVITDPTFGACRYAAELRNMLRTDDPTGKWRNGKPVDWTKFTWKLWKITINGRITVTRKTGPVVRSDASNAPVRIHDNHLYLPAPLTVRIDA